MTTAMKLPFLFSNRYVYGGPIAQAPQGMFCLKLAPEVEAPHDLLLPVRDFSVPMMQPQIIRDILFEVLDRVVNGEQVYVGCRGGQGRTGLFLALLAKAVGVSNPVEYVRREFNPAAVETREQEDYVRGFATWPLFPSVSILNFKALWKDIGG